MWCPGPGEKRDAVPRSPGEGGMLSLIPGTKGDAVPQSRFWGERGNVVPDHWEKGGIQYPDCDPREKGQGDALP